MEKRKFVGPLQCIPQRIQERDIVNVLTTVSTAVGALLDTVGCFRKL